MEIDLAGELIIKCQNCGAEYIIDITSLDEEYFVYEKSRNMGDEVEHDFYGEYQCQDCGNVMRFTIKAFEYPVGALDYYGKESYGCEILEFPEAVVKYYDSDFDYFEEEGICQQVSRACENIERVQRNKEAIYDITPREFEELVAEVFSRQGYNVEITPATKDGGCDIIATKEIGGIPYMILIECKKYSARHKVDVQLVRSLSGVQSDRKANKVILVTSSLFTRDARQFAKRQEHLISLVDINDLMDMMKFQVYGFQH